MNDTSNYPGRSKDSPLGSAQAELLFITSKAAGGILGRLNPHDESTARRRNGHSLAPPLLLQQGRVARVTVICAVASGPCHYGGPKAVAATTTSRLHSLTQKARCRAQVKRAISSSWYAGFQGSHSAACHCRSYTVPRAVDSVCGNLCLSEFRVP